MQQSVTDVCQFLQTLSLRKIANMLKINLSYWWSVISRNATLWGMPYSLSVEPVNFCNLACPECPAGRGILTRSKQSIDMLLYHKILDENAPHLLYLMLYFQGEPYLHKHIFNLISAATKKKIYTAISTNAQLISDRYAEQTVRSGLHRIIISMDGMTQEVYESYRRKGQLSKVLDGIALIRKWREELKSPTPYIIVQFIVFGSNQHQLPGIRSFAKHAGADKVEIKTAQLYDFEQGNPLMTDITRYSRYRKKSGQYVINSNLPNRCARLWNGAVITASGGVVPCCFDKDATWVMGDLQTETLSAVWKSDTYHKFRQSLLHDRKQYEMCRNCSQ